MDFLEDGEGFGSNIDINENTNGSKHIFTAVVYNLFFFLLLKNRARLS